MFFTDDDFPLIEGRYYELEDGRVVGPVTMGMYDDPGVYLRVGFYDIPGYGRDEVLRVLRILPVKVLEPTPEPPKPDYSEFLREMSALTRKHGVEIAGCGCCGSPFLVDLGDGVGHYVVDEDNNNLEWELPQ